MSTSNDTPETVTIQLTQGQQTIISPEDADLSKTKWNAGYRSGYSGGNYVAIKYTRVGGKKSAILLHRVILARILGRELVKGEICDHKDGNPLNNTRGNLRLATYAQNMSNRKHNKDKEIPYKGVYKRGKRFRALITVNGTWHNLGNFDTAEEAHEAYKQAAIELNGEFAKFI